MVIYKRNWAVLALAAVTIGLVGCGSGDGGDTKTTGSTATAGNPGGPTGTGSGASGGTAGGKRPAVTAEGNKAGDTIKIGLVASITGSEAPWGLDAQEGAKMAVEEFNAAGGAHGKKVELLVGDSASDPEKGKNAALKLMDDGSILLLGEVASGITIQMAKAAYPKGIPVIAIGATRDDITDEGANVFRVCYTDSFQGPVMAQFAFAEKNLKNVAILTDKKLPYSTGLSNSFRAHYEKIGGTVPIEEFYEKGQQDFRSQLTNIKDKNPDGLFLSGYFTEVGPIARQAADMGLKVVMLGGDGWDSSAIITAGGAGIIGGYFCNHYNNADSRPQVVDFLKKWAAKHQGGTPGTTMGALGYDAAALALDAIKRATAPNSKEVLAAIDATEGFPAVSGDITLNGMGGNPPKRALVVEVTDKDFVFRKAYEPKDLQN